MTVIKLGKGGQILYDVRIPGSFLPQPLAGKIRTQPAKRNAALEAAEKDRAAAGLLPFLTFSAAFQAALAKTALFFQAADATFAARCDRAKINLPIHTITIPAPC